MSARGRNGSPGVSPRIAVVDYGMGNRRSAEKALARVGAEAIVTDDHDALRAADGLLLPGVGAFPAAMAAIRARRLDRLLVELASASVPLFGACLGMQLLFERSSEHGGAAGLGLLAGDVTALSAPGSKLPHIGWSAVRWLSARPAGQEARYAAGDASMAGDAGAPADPGTADGTDGEGAQARLRDGLPETIFLYHVHSFVARPADPAVVLAVAEYGEAFPAVVGRGNVFGTQSHPEKSSTHGLRLLRSFAAICAGRASVRASDAAAR